MWLWPSCLQLFHTSQACDLEWTVPARNSEDQSLAHAWSLVREGIPTQTAATQTGPIKNAWHRQRKYMSQVPKCTGLVNGTWNPDREPPPGLASLPRAYNKRNWTLPVKVQVGFSMAMASGQTLANRRRAWLPSWCAGSGKAQPQQKPMQKPLELGL